MPPHAQPPGPGQALSADSSVGANLLPEARVVHLQDSRLLTVLLQVIIPQLKDCLDVACQEFPTLPRKSQL
jgi:hypothetical protein